MNFASRYAYANHSDSEDEEVVVDSTTFDSGLLSAAAPVGQSVLGRGRQDSFGSLSASDDDDDRGRTVEGDAPDNSRGVSVLDSMFNVFRSSSRQTAAPAAAAPPAMMERAPPPMMARAAPQPRVRVKPKVYKRRVDTNVVSLRLGSLGENAPVATGDAVYCESCAACLSCISTLTPHASGEGSQWVWNCEFCGHENTVELEEEEKPNPTQNTVDYIIEQAAEAAASTAAESFTVYCIDISGSMCVTQPVAGNFRLLGDRRAAMANLRAQGDNYDQRLPNEQRGVTYVSRLQAVQAAVQSQIKHVSEEQPNAKVAIVTFNHEVTVIGDGTAQPTVVSGDRLGNFEALLERGKAARSEKAISECYESLEAKLFGLEEGGPTALGPAVVTALGMCEGKPGARIVVCTDGLANVGLGSVEGLDTADDATKDAANAFYDRVGQLAADQGVCIDVVGIRSDGCDLERLGRMAELANGNVSLVDPLNLHNDFHGILANPVVATQVSIKLLLHRGLKFRAVDGASPFATSKDASSTTDATRHDSVLQHMVGNVTTDTELTVEYQLRPSAERRAMGIGELTTLPFQLQITYTRLNGMKCVRIMTQSQQVTANRADAEQEADLRVLSSHAAQQTAKMAAEGVYTKSRGNMRVWSNFMSGIATGRSRNVEEQSERLRTINMYANDMDQLDSAVMQAQAQEEEEYGRTYSDSEDDPTPSAAARASAPVDASKARREYRSKNDDLSSRIKKASKTSYR